MSTSSNRPCFPRLLPSRTKQAGSALLAMMLVLVVSASYVLVSRLNDAAGQISRQSSTIEVLNEAKAALIGYAVSYPERSGNPNGASGTLPCPEYYTVATLPSPPATWPNGQALGNCSSAAGTNIGRLPWATLRLGWLRDHSGEDIWYVVDNNFRTTQITEINSDTATALQVDNDADTDIVAIIFSPGLPFPNQARVTDANKLDLTNYLEAGNADGNDLFVTTFDGDFNDTVVTITREELMRAVEKRVLGDVAEAVNNYQATHDAFPWLSPIPVTPTSAFRGQNSQYGGHLPFHWTLDSESDTVAGTGLGVPGRNPFNSDITLTWSFSNASSPSPGNTQNGNVSGYDLYRGNMVTPDVACLQSNVCADPNYPGISTAAPITFNNAQCTWSSVDVFQCTGTIVTSDTTAYPEINTVADWAYAFNIGDNEIILKWDNGAWVADGSFLGRANATGWNMGTQVIYAYTETVDRTYTLNITFTDDTADGADIVDPTAGTERTRNLQLENFDIALTPGQGTALHTPGANSVSLRIDETRTIEVTGSPSATSPTTSVSSSRTLTNDADTKGIISATGLQYDMDIDGGELPPWFVQNDWHELIYLGYASGEPLPGDTNPTDSGPDGIADAFCHDTDTGAACLTVDANGITLPGNIRAVAVSAGVDLTPLTARTIDLVGEYFESNNATVNDNYEKDRISATTNDQTRIIATAP